MRVLTLRHSSFTDAGIFGRIFDENEDLVCCTLEHAFLINGIWGAIIPSGIYTCQRRLSPRFGFEVFQIMNVPGHDFVEIHIGNWNKDSDGCILLGTRIDGSMLMNSEIAFKGFMEMLKDESQFQLVIE